MVRHEGAASRKRGRGTCAAACTSRPAATLFVITHDMITAGKFCDRVAFVVDGRIVACLTCSTSLVISNRCWAVAHRLG